MAGATRRALVDPARLAERLKVIASANRIELLRRLQMPLTLGEIELGPSRSSRSLDEDRKLAKQTVQHHVEVLREAGFVRARRALRGTKEVEEYHVDHAELFLLVEELKSLALIRTARGQLDERTSAEATPSERDDDELSVSLPKGPTLVLMTGPLIGTPFELKGPGPWLLGRGASCQVPVRFDPFVSAENAVVERQGGTFLLRALPTARNGTFLNWKRLADGAAQVIGPGDVVGVGRSLLLLRGL